MMWKKYYKIYFCDGNIESTLKYVKQNIMTQ